MPLLSSSADDLTVIQQYYKKTLAGSFYHKAIQKLCLVEVLLILYSNALKEEQQLHINANLLATGVLFLCRSENKGPCRGEGLQRHVIAGTLVFTLS